MKEGIYCALSRKPCDLADCIDFDSWLETALIPEATGVDLKYVLRFSFYQLCPSIREQKLIDVLRTATASSDVELHRSSVPGYSKIERPKSAQKSTNSSSISSREIPRQI